MTETKVEGTKVYYLTPRGIKRPVSKSQKNISVYVTKDFKIGPYGSIEVVETGKEDFQALVQSHKDDCGLTHVIEMARKQAIDPATQPFAFNETDAVVDPGFSDMTFSEQKEALAAADDTKARNALGEVAKMLNCSVEDLIQHQLDGSLETFIQKNRVEEVKTNEE